MGNLIVKLGNVSLLATHQHKKDVSVLTLFQENCLCLWMWLSLRQPHFGNNHLQGESESENSCIGNIFQIELELLVLVEFTPDHPNPSALENRDTTTTNQHLNGDTTSIDWDPNTIAIDQDLSSLGDEINGTNPSMPLHKHEKTSERKHGLRVYSRKRHIRRKEYSTLQQPYESNPSANQNSTSSSNELSGKIPWY